MNLNTILLAACAALALNLPATSSVIFNNADPPLSTTNRDNSIEGVAAYLQIGASDVTIGQIAINARPFQDGQLKFVIFSDSAPPGGSSGSLLFSDPVDVSASSSLSYILSDPLSFTLQAGQYYDIGAIFSGTDISYTYDFTADSENGIISIVSSQNIDDFGNPIQAGHGGVSDISIELYSQATLATEPAVPLLIGLGLTFVGLLAYSHKDRNATTPSTRLARLAGT